MVRVYQVLYRSSRGTRSTVSVDNLLARCIPDLATVDCVIRAATCCSFLCVVGPASGGLVDGGGVCGVCSIASRSLLHLHLAGRVAREDLLRG